MSLVWQVVPTTFIQSTMKRLIVNLSDRHYSGEVNQGDMTKYEDAVELVFTEENRQEIEAAWRNVEVRARLGALGVLVFGGLVTLISSSALVPSSAAASNAAIRWTPPHRSDSSSSDATTFPGSAGSTDGSCGFARSFHATGRDRRQSRDERMVRYERPRQEACHGPSA